MNEKKLCRIKIGEQEVSDPNGTTFEEIAKAFRHAYQNDIILCAVNGKIQELFKPVKNDETLTFLTTQTPIGHRTYERSIVFVMLKAVYKVIQRERIRRVQVMFSIDKGVYFEIEGEVTPNEALRDAIEAEMRRIVEADMPVRKSSIETGEAKRRFHTYGMLDKERLFHYRIWSRVNLYDLDGFQDYFYGAMAVSTGILKYFKLYLYEQGFLLQIPDKKTPDVLEDFRPTNKLFNVMKESDDWGKLMHVQNVAELNDEIVAGRAGDLVLVQEALQEKKIGYIADEISEKPEKKFILIAGPSSSGKTSFANRLSIQLKAHGLRPHPISVDNYFVNREDTPKDDAGEYDFEDIHALDLTQLNKDLQALLAGETVPMPTYNFVKGRREYLGNTLHLGENEVLVIEGIHCLNDELTYLLDAKSKYKIYISALTTLNIDEHNRIPTTDARLLRRMVRDARTRGISAKETIAMWPSVRRGEEKNIFPYQESADCMFNSASIYELAVLKPYCEPLLYGIEETAPEYIEAKHILKFLNYFLGFGSECLPQNSIVREFVGGSCFNV